MVEPWIWGNTSSCQAENWLFCAERTWSFREIPVSRQPPVPFGSRTAGCRHGAVVVLSGGVRGIVLQSPYGRTAAVPGTSPSLGEGANCVTEVCSGCAAQSSSVRVLLGAHAVTRWPAELERELFPLLGDPSPAWVCGKGWTAMSFPTVWVGIYWRSLGQSICFLTCCLPCSCPSGFKGITSRAGLDLAPVKRGRCGVGRSLCAAGMGCPGCSAVSDTHT